MSHRDARYRFQVISPYKKAHYEYIGSQDRKSLDEPKEKTPQPNKARDVNPPTYAVNASVSQTYDAQEEPELQRGTEAILQVSQSNRQSANSNLLHGIPDPQPLTQPQNATKDQEREKRMKRDKFSMK